MQRTLTAMLLVALIAGCGAPVSSAEPGSSSPEAEPASVASPAASPEATAVPSPTPEPTPSASAAPRALFGIWRTTLGGTPLSLVITESTYRIVRGGNAGAGSVSVDGDRIEFFDSDLCSGTGVYRWAIADGALSFFPLETEPCSGRAEALLVRYPEYTPPDGG